MPAITRAESLRELFVLPADDDRWWRAPLLLRERVRVKPCPTVALCWGLEALPASEEGSPPVVVALGVAVAAAAAAATAAAAEYGRVYARNEENQNP